MEDMVLQAAALDELESSIDISLGTEKMKQGYLDRYKICILGVIVVFIMMMITASACSILIYKELHPQNFCQDKWIGFQNKCYYFSEDEKDWNSSRNNCSAQKADLTMIDTPEEMHFLSRYKCTSDHWIGLMMTANREGKWINATKFNKWFTVRGNEECAYLNGDGVATARCYTERKWICRKKIY